MFAPPRTDGESSLRANLRRARDLLAAAGWNIQGGVLRNSSGEAMVIEYLDSNEGGARVVAPWARNLEKLGVQLNYRAVDFALYQQRLSKFEFDIISLAYGGTHNPGQEYAEMFGSKASVTEDSGNMAGVSNPAVDAIIARMTSAKTKADLLPACRALDRVISHSHYLIPQWTASTHRMAFNDRRLARPALTPPYSTGEGWAIFNWWAR
jgi:microcin C transport system substrate-binding protein